MLMSLNVTSMQPGKFADKIQARINFQHDVFNPICLSTNPQARSKESFLTLKLLKEVN